MRRLTRFEYSNIVRDVFGTEVDVASILPRDEVSLGFDNQAGALTVTDLHVDAYLKAADQVATAVLADPEILERLGGCGEASQQCAEQTARELGRRLLRRALSNKEVERLLELFSDDFSQAGVTEGMSRVIAALLQTPEFVYRVERSPALAAPTRKEEPSEALELSPYLLASRLSFLLWGSAPDSTLLDAAERGTLNTRSELEAQARRMLEDDRARRGVLHFFRQWLELSNFQDVEKDTRLLPIWDDEVRQHLARETDRFLEAVLWEEGGKFKTLMTGRFTYATPLLMDFYDLPITSSEPEALVRVDFAGDEHRFGVLTQAALLSHLAKADQTSPIHRGKFIRERFFCTIPEPPPPNIVVAPPRLDPRKTTRERFEQHRSDPACASCHELLDPIGLSFEHYDAVGRYRTQESGIDIDASGFLVETDVDGPVYGVEELATKLTESAQVRRCVVTQVFRYAFGRGETDADLCTIDKLEQQFAATDGNLQELLVAVTQTEPFVSPTLAPASEEQP